MKRNICIICLMLLCFTVVYSEKGRIDDTELGIDLSLNAALDSLSRIADSLNSFAIFTDMFREKISDKDKKDIGNTDWEIQNIGFNNWKQCIHGTLLKQELKIRHLEYKLAVAEKSDEYTVKKRSEALKNAEKNMSAFYESCVIND